MLAHAGSADQQLKRPAEPAALAGDDLVVDALLRRIHLGEGDLAVTAHRCIPLLRRIEAGEPTPILHAEPARGPALACQTEYAADGFGAGRDRA